MMPAFELAAAAYLFWMSAFVSTSDWWVNKVIFKVPAPIFGAVLFADAFSRIGWI